jgi:hypothetical protein
MLVLLPYSYSRSLVRNFTRTGADLATAFAAMNMAIATWLATNVSTNAFVFLIFLLEIKHNH